VVDQRAHLFVSHGEGETRGSLVEPDNRPSRCPRFLISTHYVKYDPKLFFINFAACVFVLFPKLPAVSRRVADPARLVESQIAEPFALSAPSTAIPFHPAREQTRGFQRGHAEP